MEKKSIFKKWWFWVIVAIVVIYGIGSLNKSDDGATKEAAGSPSSTAQSSETNKPKESKPSEEPSEEPSPEPEPSEDSRTITQVGEVITTKNFKFTLEKLNKPKGNEFNKPADGNEFVDVGLIIENISDSDYIVSSMLMFNAYYDGFSMNQSITAAIADNAVNTMDGALAAGKKIRGKLSYELPKDWKELEIDVDLTKLSLFSKDGEIKILLKNGK